MQSEPVAPWQPSTRSAAARPPDGRCVLPTSEACTAPKEELYFLLYTRVAHLLHYSAANMSHARGTSDSCMGSTVECTNMGPLSLARSVRVDERRIALLVLQVSTVLPRLIVFSARRAPRLGCRRGLWLEALKEGLSIWRRLGGRLLWLEGNVEHLLHVGDEPELHGVAHLDG